MKLNLRRAAALPLLLAMLLSLSGCASGDYRRAERLYAAGSYESAAEMFDSLRDYKDSAERADECRYRLALDAMDARDYAAAAELLETLGTYKDARKLLPDAEEGLLRSSVCGGRISEDADMSALALELLSRRLGREGIEHSFEIGAFRFRLLLDVDEDGTVGIRPDEASLAAALDGLEKTLRDGMHGYLTELYTDIAHSHDLSLDELLELAECDSVEDMLEYETGMSVDALIGDILFSSGAEELIFRTCTASGTLKSSDGEALIVLPDGELRAEYDAQSGALTLSSGSSGFISAALPLSFLPLE